MVNLNPSTSAMLVSAGLMPGIGGTDTSGTMGAAKRDTWLTLEVCRVYQRTRCPRTAEECKFAHPPNEIDIQNDRIVCSFDSLKAETDMFSSSLMLQIQTVVVPILTVLLMIFVVIITITNNFSSSGANTYSTANNLCSTNYN